MIRVLDRSIDRSQESILAVFPFPGSLALNWNKIGSTRFRDKSLEGLKKFGDRSHPED
jgi:hypothetical protein